MRKALLGALLALCVASPVYARYSDAQFEAALRAYIELGRGNDLQAARRLLSLGTQLKQPEMLEDAMQAAIAARDLDLAYQAGTSWYQLDQDVEALNLLARIRIAQRGLLGASGLLKRIASESGPASVYQTIRRLATVAELEAAMRQAHPLHLRDGEYYAYLALLQLEGGQQEVADATVHKALGELQPTVGLLIVGLLVAEHPRSGLVSTELAEQLAALVGVDVLTAIYGFSSWRQHFESEQTETLPVNEDFAAPEEFPELAKLEAATFYLRHSRPELALEILTSMKVNSPVWDQVIGLTVSAYEMLEGDNTQAILDLLEDEIGRAAVEFVPGFASLRAHYLAERDGPQAAYEYLAGLERASDDTQVLYSKADYAERSGRLDEAEAALRLYIGKEPDSAHGYNALGYMFANNNVRLDEARELIVKALEIEPDSPAIIDSLGWVLYRLGDLEGARIELEKSLRIMGQSPYVEVMAHFGEVLWELGESDSAIRVWRQAYERDPNDKVLQETLKRYDPFREPY